MSDLRRLLTAALACLTAVTLLAAPASAAPDEKGDGDLSAVLETTNRKYVAAKGAVTASRKKQKQLTSRLRAAEARRDALIPEVNQIARQQYQIGDLGTAGYLLNAGSSGDFLSKAVSLEEINRLHDGRLRELNAAIHTVESSKRQIDAEVKKEQEQLTVLARQREAARKQLELIGGSTGINPSITSGFVDADSKIAAPAPRNAGGGFSPEGCTEKDLTTSGCVTKRTLHMYKEVRKAGFKRFAGCHRTGGPFEHPKGRACDWSLQNRGFAVAHNDDMRRYGNDLTAFLVRNADRLGIYYVIWYKQIWFAAGNEWRSYSGPSAHTDHVHISML
ncbi:coiled-coil domain-containing protein [Actinoplanes sp. G11-F43]|uniref:coiled-coil domain-containing protein n=1 Tax=Actinoplanes sp. G11-F43 TaxID=3424130 RepID=UPI003D33C940